MMTNDDERGGGGKKCPKFDDVICERPLKAKIGVFSPENEKFSGDCRA